MHCKATYVIGSQWINLWFATQSGLMSHCQQALFNCSLSVEMYVFTGVVVFMTSLLQISKSSSQPQVVPDIMASIVDEYKSLANDSRNAMALAEHEEVSASILLVPGSACVV